MYDIQKHVINFDLKFLISAETPEFLYGDSLRVKNVLIQLINNAIKYTVKDQKISIGVNYDNSNQHLILEVEDNGTGVPKE